MGVFNTSVSREKFTVSAKIYNLAYEKVNVTTPKFNEYLDELASLEWEYSVRGFLYLAQPATEWVITSSYLNMFLFFEGYDSRYFAGFSVPRIQFILGLPSYKDLGIDEPGDGEVTLVIDEIYRFSQDPIFDVIRDTKWLALHYPGVITINMSFQVVYMDSEPLRRDLGLPGEIVYDGRSYDFTRNPPIYLLVNRKTYIDILDLTYPKVFGEVLRIEVLLSGFESYSSLLLTLSTILDVLESGAYESGIEQVDIDIIGFTTFEERMNEVLFRIYSPFFIINTAVSIAIPISIHFFRVVKRGRHWIYIFLTYPMLMIGFTLLYSLQYYISPTVLFLHLLIPFVGASYIILKSRPR